MAKLSPAQILGRAGGKIGGKKKSADQTAARKLNAAKAREKRWPKKDPTSCPMCGSSAGTYKDEDRGGYDVCLNCGAV